MITFRIIYNKNNFQIVRDKFSELLLVEKIIKANYPLLIRIMVSIDNIKIPNYVKIEKKMRLQFYYSTYSSLLFHRKLKEYTRSYLSSVITNKGLYILVNRANGKRDHLSVRSV